MDREAAFSDSGGGDTQQSNSLDVILSNLKDWSRQMQRGEVGILCRLRSDLGDWDFAQLRQQADDWHFGVLYLVKRLLDEIWENLGTDASFEFPPDSLLISITKELGAFIESAIGSSNHRDSILHHLTAVVGNYYSFLAVMEDLALSHTDINDYFSELYSTKEGK